MARDPAPRRGLRNRALPSRDAILDKGLLLLWHAAEMPHDRERVLVIHRHAELDVIAGEEAVRPKTHASYRPQPVGLVGIGTNALVLEAVFELGEVDFYVLRRVGAGVAGEAHAPVRMRPFEMHGIDRVLLALKPVARDLGEHDLAKAILPGKEFPIRYERARFGAEICPKEPAAFLDRIGLETDLVFEPRLGVRHVLIGLREAAPIGIVEPSVVIAAQPAPLDIAIGEIGAAMPAVPVEEAALAAKILVKNEVFAHQPHWFRAQLGKLTGAGNRPPITPQQFAHRRAGAGLGQDSPAAPYLTAYLVRHV